MNSVEVMKKLSTEGAAILRQNTTAEEKWQALSAADRDVLNKAVQLMVAEMTEILRQMTEKE